MKSKSEVLEVLAGALTEELGAAVQYILHAEMCDNWGYKSLGGFTKKRAIEEMKHAEKLIERILFLEGAPDLQTFPKIEAGKDVPDQLTIDLMGEQTAIVSYNQGIATCASAGDQGTADLLLANLHDEERHADYLETQLGLIKELGLANYLAQQLAE
ncbi:MAG: bacterioferritin [Terriglobia bacterium]